MPWLDMAHDAGYRGDEQRQVAAMIEQREREAFEARPAEHERDDEREQERHEADGDVPF